MPAKQIGQTRPGALVTDVRDVDACGLGKQRGTEMDATTGSGRGVIKLARPRLRQCDQLLHVVRGHRLVHEDYERAGSNQADRREVFARVIADIWIASDRWQACR